MLDKIWRSWCEFFWCDRKLSHCQQNKFSREISQMILDSEVFDYTISYRLNPHITYQAIIQIILDKCTIAVFISSDNLHKWLANTVDGWKHSIPLQTLLGSRWLPRNSLHDLRDVQTTIHKTGLHVSAWLCWAFCALEHLKAILDMYKVENCKTSSWNKY